MEEIEKYNKPLTFEASCAKLDLILGDIFDDPFITTDEQKLRVITDIISIMENYRDGRRLANTPLPENVN